ncbi:MAG: sulfotransferase family 2 domain-containing protein [Methylovulum sp.]|uniref:sulfotransferase family 2 domain-containing protein n=1 Tax=Methylovulum sp. TaxID=1916980 RepID=UPI002632810A|nr:sulfotransferase family 2 domain-containing protein [Methylovulum sp.]MDD2725470.1 sulfotransferase family 2 domain-containing protein [Methylovulum sp.]
MIISHKHKFIFLKTVKTAGTSIEIALSKHCGPDDIITPISPEDEIIRKELGYQGPQNFKTPKIKFYNHMPATEIKANIDPEIWDSYFKFCFVRNPWDRAVSLYYYLHQSEPRPSLSEFIGSGQLNRLLQGGLSIYTIDGQIAVDRVCQFEKITEELEAIRIKLDIAETLELPNAKSRFRQDKRSYRDLLSEDDKAKIARRLAEEIRLFDYQF